MTDELDQLLSSLDGVEETTADTAVTEPETETEADTVDDDEPLFSEQELADLIASSPLGKQAEPAPEPFTLSGITGQTTDEEIAARVALPEDPQAYEAKVEELALRVEELRAQRDSVPANRPLLRAKVERAWATASGERAAVETAWELRQQEKVMQLYEKSPQAQQEREQIEHMRSVAEAESAAMVASAERERKQKARTLAKSQVRWGNPK